MEHREDPHFKDTSCPGCGHHLNRQNGLKVASYSVPRGDYTLLNGLRPDEALQLVNTSVCKIRVRSMRAVCAANRRCPEVRSHWLALRRSPFGFRKSRTRRNEPSTRQSKQSRQSKARRRSFMASIATSRKACTIIRAPPLLTALPHLRYMCNHRDSARNDRVLQSSGPRSRSVRRASSRTKSSTAKSESCKESSRTP